MRRSRGAVSWSCFGSSLRLSSSSRPSSELRPIRRAERGAAPVRQVDVLRRPPEPLAAFLNGCRRLVGMAGLAPRRLHALEVRRPPNRPPAVIPVVVADCKGERYLAMLGERANWLAACVPSAGRRFSVTDTARRGVSRRSSPAHGRRSCSAICGSPRALVRPSRWIRTPL